MKFEGINRLYPSDEEIDAWVEEICGGRVRVILCYLLSADKWIQTAILFCVRIVKKRMIFFSMASAIGEVYEKKD